MRQYFENGATVIVTTEKDRMPRAKTEYTGIGQTPDGLYYVRTANTYLGSYRSLDEAVEVRAESVTQLDAGTFKKWASQFRKNNVRKQNKKGK